MISPASLEQSRPVRAGTPPDQSIVAIIPLYNGQKYIEQAIASILDQTLKPDEIVIVDDGSTDNGPTIAHRLARSAPITVLHKRNGGQSSARNLGVARSKSALIAFLDQDDAWHPHHLEELVRPFRERRAIPLGWVYSNLDEIDESGQMVSRSFLNAIPNEHPKQNLMWCIAQDMFVLPSASLIARTVFEAVGGFDEDLCGYEDDDLFLRIFRGGYDNVYINAPLSLWRIYSTSTSYTTRMAKSRMVYAQKLFSQYPDDAEKSRYFCRDLIAPRFLGNIYADYFKAVRTRNRTAMRNAVRDLAIVLPHLDPKKRKRLRLLLVGMQSYPLARLLYMGKNLYKTRTTDWLPR